VGININVVVVDSGGDGNGGAAALPAFPAAISSQFSGTATMAYM